VVGDVVKRVPSLCSERDAGEGGVAIAYGEGINISNKGGKGIGSLRR